MSLTQYNQKRNFKKTAEPKGKEEHSRGSLRFVVQKHDASSLHYDFRIEMDGVLKSWAVPKGPSLRPSDKRLAMMVEDHPFSYRKFEGVIPEGEYGAGTVIVWDEGTYEPSNLIGKKRKEQEEELLRQLESGKIGIVLHGQKLKGEFTLIQMKGRGENTWMLIKKKDSQSREQDITEEEASVKSGKTLMEVALDHGATVRHPVKQTTGGKKSAAPKKATAKKETKPKPDRSTKTKALLRDDTQGTKPADMPAKFIPMLATLIDEPFDNKDWLFEIKWDGYRAVAYCQGESVELVSRNLKPFTQKYAPVAQALRDLNIQAVFDGEIVAVDEQGLANFQALQNWQNTPVQLRYYIFDLLWLNGQDLTQLPLIQRKQILEEVIPADLEHLRYSDHVEEKGKSFFKAAVKQGLEGIMAKRVNSIYQVGTRTPDWAKIKVAMRQEVVIAGYTEPRKTRKYFGSLLLGVYEGEKLVYIGHTGSGFTTKTLEQIYKKLQPLIVSKSPFAKTPKTNMPATWVKPQLVCEIKFIEWTSDRIARHAIFMGLREDKKATDVHFEKTTAMATLKKVATPAKKTGAKKQTAPKKRNVKKGTSITPLIDPENAEDQVVTIKKQEVTITNPQKVYWPKEGFRKGDMVNYYHQIAPYILPYLMDRPHSLNRHPNGIAAANFFQKDMAGKVPEWIETFDEFSESTGKTVEYLVCKNEATLIYMANLGCIEINPWHARIQDYLKPDWCLIDLDPDKTNTFDEVVDVANMVHKILEEVGAASCVKTSGSTGIHIYIPLGAKYGFDESKQLAEMVVSIVNNELAGLTSMERSPAKRKGKIYLDFLQNKETQTAAAPYSLRPKPGMPVSTPLDWSEVKKGLTPTTWNANNILDRVKSEGDLFAPVLKKGIDLEKVLKKLQSRLK
ncbi:MAG TPA: DNA ligase D [Flavisolibacter sp.]|jgi:bifunctional non-homologous end joining protein LigD|nr:DNA ligase D [Flavisolibacter sp.]